MAFDPNSLSVISYANGFTQWHYESAECADVEGYFDRAAEMLRGGDLIVWVSGDGESREVRLVAVCASRPGSVVCDLLRAGKRAKVE